MADSVYDFTVTTIMGLPRSMRDYAGKVLLIVNTASKCGFTPQYAGLQELYDTYQGRGFEVLGFPCNQFMNQEPGGADEIQQFCQVNYGVTFPMFDKIEVLSIAPLIADALNAVFDDTSVSEIFGGENQS